MHPILLRWPLITSYGAMMLVGLIGGWVLGRVQARRAGIDPSHIDLMAPLVVLGGIAGAVGLWAVAEPGVVGESAGHGRVLFGGLLAAVATGIVYALIARIRLGELGDIFAAPIALGIAAGRIGCYVAGCCWGKPCGDFSLGVRFPRWSYAFRQQLEMGSLEMSAPASLRVHPTQLYEAAAVALVGTALFLLWRYRRVSGELFLALGSGYATVRFAVEFLRADNPAIAMGLTLSQWVSVGAAVVCGVTFGTRRVFADRLGLRVGTAQ